jgi:hypothetical protein
MLKFLSTPSDKKYDPVAVTNACIEEFKRQREKQEANRKRVGRPNKLQNINNILHSKPEESSEIKNDSNNNNHINKSRINWFESPYIHDIIAAYTINKTGYMTVQYLNKKFPKLSTENIARFELLAPSTIDCWFQDGELKSQYQQLLAGKYETKRGNNISSTFGNNLELEMKIINCIETMRNTGATIKINQIRIVMRAYILKYKPNLLKEFNLSKAFISSWIRNKLGWRIRRGTTAAQKLPADWKQQGKTMIERIAALVKQYKVIPELIINFDQTAVHIVPKSKTTYAPCGDKSVALVGADDKRQITAVVASSYAGVLLPLQFIFAGKTTACHPDHTDETKQYGFHLTHSESHWSTLQTMEEYFEFIIQTYISKVIKEKNLNPTTTKAIVLLDCWNVHLSEEFRRIVRQKFNSNILLIYIPANCTSELQVADIALNYSFKCGVRNRYESWATENMMKQLDCEMDKIPSIDTKLSVLKPLILKWSFESWFNLSNRPELIKKGWDRCITNILDPFDIKVQEIAAEKVFKSQLQAYGFVPKEAEKDENYNSDSESDSDKDELDVLEARVYGSRKSSRKKKQTKSNSYMINSSQIQLDSDEEML